MSGGSENMHLVGGPENAFQEVVPTGHAQIESSYQQFITPPRLQFPATKNVPVQLENIPCSKVIITNLIGNDPIYVGGLAEQSPYFDLNYPGDFRGTILYEGMSKPFPVRNANLLQVVGTPLQSFTYEAYPNINQKILTSTDSPPNPDTFPPEVLFTDPQDESTGILIDRTDFTITMDEPILPSSVNTNNVTINPGVQYDVFPDPLNNTRIRIQLLQDLQYATLYTISVVVGGLKDFSENAVNELALIQFTTEPSPPSPPPPDTTKPTVTATNPLDNATLVPRDKIVTINFSEAMLASSVTTSTVQVTPAISYDVFVNPVNTSQVVINHSVLFSYNTVYTITLSANGVKDLAGNGILSQFIFDFTIEPQPTVPDQTPPTVTAIDPVNGATGVVRDKTVTLTFSEAILESSITTATIVLAPTVAYTVFRDPTDSTKVKLDPSVVLSGSVLHTITLPVGGIKDLSENGLANQLQFTFTTEAAPPPADTTPPIITARSPVGGSTNVSVSTPIIVDFSEPLLTPIPANSFELFAPGPTEITAVTITLENSNTRLRMVPTSALSFNTSYTVFSRTTLEDVAGNNLVSQDSFSFTTAATPPAADTTPPTIVARTPTPNALNQARDTSVIIDFSEPLDPATIHSNSVELFKVSNGQEILCNITLSSIASQANRRVTLTPSALLEYNTQYQAFVRTLVKDVAGNPLAAESSWFFTTTEPLSIVARSPTVSASSVAVASDVFVDFNKAINPATVTSSTFQLFNTSTGVQVTAGVITFENGNQRIRFNPTANLDMSTQYQVIVKASVADSATGITLGADDTWFFTTVIQFAVTNRAPIVDATNVPISTAITIDFNKALNTTTVTNNTVELFDTTTDPDTEVTCTRTFANGNTRIIMTPSAALGYSKVYQVFIRTGVLASDGSTLAAQVSWFFTTENNPVVITQVYNVAGNSSEWWTFGDIRDGERQGRGLKITSTEAAALNGLHNVRPTQVTVKVRRVGNFSAPQDDDSIYCRIRNSSGALMSTLGIYTGALSLTTSSSGASITFSNSNQSYKMVNGDCLLIEYDDGDDDEFFELNQVAGGPSAYSQEVYRENDGTLVTTSKDMAATIYGQRMP